MFRLKFVVSMLFRVISCILLLQGQLIAQEFFQRDLMDYSLSGFFMDQIDSKVLTNDHVSCYYPYFKGDNEGLAYFNEDIQGVDELVRKIEVLMRQQHIPGMMLSIVGKDGVIWSGGLGKADIEKGKEVNEKTLFRMGSITKTIASLAIQKLISEGKFNLNDKLGKIAPEVPFYNPFELTHPVRVVHLLEHSAGFDDMHYHATYNLGRSELSSREMLDIHQTALTSRWKPGSRFAYSNPGYVVLTYLIEKFSGTTYADYVQKNILAPLDMHSSDVAAFPLPAKDYAKGYAYNRQEKTFHPIKRYAIHGGMAGNLHSNAEDMAKLIQFFLSEGEINGQKLIPGFQLTRMERPRSTLAAKSGLSLVYGLGLYEQLGWGHNYATFHGHGGGINGFTSSFAYNRELGVGFALSNNGQAMYESVARLIGTYLTRKAYPPRLKSVPLTHSQIAPFLGYYRMNHSRHQLLSFMEPLIGGVWISFERGKLYYQFIDGLKRPLRHIGERKFCEGKWKSPTVALSKDDRGKPVVMLAGGGIYAERASEKLDKYLRIGFISALLIPALLIFLGLLWVLLCAFRKFSYATWRVRLIPVFAGLAEWGMFFLFLMAMFNPMRSGQFNSLSLSYFFVSALFALLALWSPIQLIRNWKSIQSHLVGLVLLILSLNLSLMAMYCWQYGLIALRFWSY